MSGLVTDRKASYAEQLSRARALLHARLPADLATWIEEQLEANASADYLRLRRDQCLRQAGEIFGGSVNNRATRILECACTLERCWPLYRERAPEPGTAFGAVHAARLILPVPRRRQLLKLLARGVHSAPL